MPSAVPWTSFSPVGSAPYPRKSILRTTSSCEGAEAPTIPAGNTVAAAPAVPAALILSMSRREILFRADIIYSLTILAFPFPGLKTLDSLANGSPFSRFLQSRATAAVRAGWPADAACMDND